MAELFDSDPVRASVSNCPTEGMLREYLDDLLSTLDCDRVRDSCARERALACIIRGVVERLAINHATLLSHRDLAEIAFGELEDRFGWYGDDAAVLELYAGIWPSIEEENHLVAEERFRADAYSRHAADWRRCVEVGAADVEDWLTSDGEHSHSAVVAVVEGAAVAVGDE